MTAVDGGQQNLVQGVSQQPRRDRRDGQCTLQENMSSDVVRNLSRRAATEALKLLFSDATENDFIEFDFGAGELYWVALKANSIRVFDKDGVEKTVAATGTSYLGSSGHAHTIVEETMYIANTDVVAKMATTTKAYVSGALVQIIGGQYGRVYEISLTDPDVTVSYTTPNGGSASHILDIATDAIATSLETALNAESAFTTNYTVVRANDVLHITRNSGNDRIEITGADGEGGVQLVALSDRLSTETLLPRFAPEGYVVKVTGLDTAEEDDVFFEFIQDEPGFGNEGLWVETVAPNIEFEWDTATMPHTLVKEADGSFTFAEAEWVDRRVGDNNTNEIPSIDDAKIKDLSSFQGRVVLLTQNRVVMSRTDEPLDLWKQSATLTSDDDRIDIGSTSNEAHNMRYLVPHNRDLVIFSEKAQFIVFGRSALTPNNASIVLTTNFEVEVGARPAPSGRNVFFATNFGSFTGIREFFTEGSADINDSRPVTSHVNRYIEGIASRLTSTSNFDVLLVQTTNDKEMYVYEFLWGDNEKLQSSWGKWIFKRDVVYTYFDNSSVYMIVRQGSDYVLERMDLDVQEDVGLVFQSCLDHKQWVSSATTAYTLIYDAEDVVAVQGAGCPHPGLLAPIASTAGKVVTLSEEYGAGATVIFGWRFLSRYKPTMPLVKDEKNIKIGTGSLVINNMLVSYVDTGYFETKITSDFLETLEDGFSGRVVGSPSNLLGEQPITSGVFYVDVGDDADLCELELFSNHHTPMGFIDIEWEGQWLKKGRRV